MERMRRLRAGISNVDSAERLRELGVDVFLGDGRFVGAGHDRGRRQAAPLPPRGHRDRRPRRRPPIPGLAEAGYLTNETIFNLTELPQRLVVIGGGPIGCEMAQAFARFGSQVTLSCRSGHVLPREDADAAEIVQQAMIAERRALRIRHEGRRGAAPQGGDKVVVFERDGRAAGVGGDEILVAAGRAPNVEGLGLEAAGVRYDKRGRRGGRPPAHQQPAHLRLRRRRLPLQFTHAADAQARIVIQNALFFGRAKASALTIPWCTYTTPEVAHVGLYEKDAQEKGLEVETLTIHLADVDRAILDGEDEGFLRAPRREGPKERRSSAPPWSPSTPAT